MKATLTLTLFLWTFGLNAQTTTYLNDLAALKSILERTPSFKAQIKGEKLASYRDLYGSLASDTVSDPDSYQYFYHLSQLLFPLKDNHLGFYRVHDFEKFKDKESIDKFAATKEFLAYPQCEVNIDSLKAALTRKPAESIEGIYHFGKFYDVGVFRSNDREYIGVIVGTETKLWQKGQIAIHLYEYGPNLYKAIYGHPLTKDFSLRTPEKYQYGSLVNSFFYVFNGRYVYTKQHPRVDHVNLPVNRPKFELKNINNDVQYLLIKTFQANGATRQQSREFYDSIKNALTAPKLILDLRNNEGGAEKETKKYYQLLKKYVNKGNLYVLLNNETVSQAEIFTLRLNKLKNTITAGQPTKGMLTYGSNYGKKETLPSGNFQIYITDMKGKPKHLKYEDLGIEPEIRLNNNSNWIDQVVELKGRK
ncbi:peptidase S41-like protein [Anseongella ginsenosidimutans]|uniref:Peptidase S41-like protein n=1 Tax=Anseongella ginsenosidimutans TaxID=496056 RepID=A0A4R3KLY3_9SPHI|nr:S41 family peptidase [Anseongella ginsenosidimutans]TCS84646.1 peptidase S41-like protein [Anseongella ginsenosidimutans]